MKDNNRALKVLNGQLVSCSKCGKIIKEEESLVRDNGTSALEYICADGCDLEQALQPKEVSKDVEESLKLLRSLSRGYYINKVPIKDTETLNRHYKGIDEHIETIRNYINQQPTNDIEIKGLNEISDEEALELLFKFSYKKNENIDFVSARWLRKQLGKVINANQQPTNVEVEQMLKEIVEIALENKPHLKDGILSNYDLISSALSNVETKSAKEMFCGIDYFDYGNRNSESELYVFEKHITRGSNFEQDSLIITIDRSLDVEKTMGSSGKRIMFNPEEIQALNQLFKELEEE